MFLLDNHHRVVDLEKVVPYLGCIRISTQIDCCCCFEHRLFLPLSLWCFWRKLEQWLLLRLLNEIIDWLLQHTTLSRLWRIVRPCRCNRSLLVPAKFGWLWSRPRNIVIRWKSNTCFTSINACRLFIYKLDFKPTISWLRLTSDWWSTLDRIFLILEFYLILFYV